MLTVYEDMIDFIDWQKARDSYQEKKKQHKALMTAHFWATWKARFNYLLDDFPCPERDAVIAFEKANPEYMRAFDLELSTLS